MDERLAAILSSLQEAINFDQAKALPHANTWCIPVVGAPRAHGNIQSEIEMLVLMWALVLMTKPNLVIETGTDSGVMARALGCAVRANGFGRVLSAEVDAELARSASVLCQGLPVEIRNVPALELPIEEADLLFIDSSYESRKQELMRIVKPTAIAVLHDTVREPSMAAEAEKYSRTIHILNPRGCAILQPARKSPHATDANHSYGMPA